MSLTRDGIWEGGIWASTVWAQDVWYETAAAGSGSGGSIRQVFYNFADHLNKNLTSNYYVVHFGRFGVSSAVAVLPKFRGLLINVGRFMT